LSNIAYYWKTIEDFLKITDIEIYNSLSGPAEERNIKKLENLFKINLPDSFKESLSIHNGQVDDDPIITFVNRQKLLSVNVMIKDYNKLLMVYDDISIEMIDPVKPKKCKYIKRNYDFNNKWLKFTATDGWSFNHGYKLDFDPAVKGTIGQVIFRCGSDKIIAKSYENWMEKLCEQIDNKEYIIAYGKKEIIFDDLSDEI
jgi:cell wall assembly regulator SMI1